MAQGSIRIIRDTVPSVGGEPIQDSVPAPTSGLRIEPEAPGDSTSNRPSTATNRTRKHSETKRTTLTVEDRNGTPSSKVNSTQPGRTTPAPPKAEPTVARVYNRKRPVYYSESESKQTASYLVSAMEMVGYGVAGPVGEMTEFERGIMTPTLSRILQRTPIGLVEKANPIIDASLLIMGGAMYFMRVSGGVKFPSKPKSKGVQEDTQAPQSAKVENTVSQVRAGDVDGIAQPVPSVIMQHLNGSI